MFALQVLDDSMGGRQIVAGDVLIFEHGLEPRSGDVVAAFVDGESVVRSYVVRRWFNARLHRLSLQLARKANL